MTDNDIITCKACNGTGIKRVGKSIDSYMNVYSEQDVACFGCKGTGLLRVSDLKPVEVG